MRFLKTFESKDWRSKDKWEDYLDPNDLGYTEVCANIIVPQIKELFYIIEDEGGKVIIRRSASYANRYLIQIEKENREYESPFGEFIDRCKSICAENYYHLSSILPGEFRYNAAYIILPDTDGSKNEQYFPDLSDHEVMKNLRKSTHPNTQEFLKKNRFVNIGWLDKDHDFPKGEVDPKIIEKLKKIEPFTQTKGWHECEFCDTKEEAWEARGSSEGKIPGKEGIFYCYPEMMIHYITKHGYKPPQEFLDAVEAFEVKEPKKPMNSFSRGPSNRYKKSESKVFEKFKGRDMTDTIDSIMTVKRDNYSKIEQEFNITEEDISNLMTDLLDDYPDICFECLFCGYFFRSPTQQEDPEFQIAIYRNINSNREYLEDDGIDDTIESIIGRFRNMKLNAEILTTTKRLKLICVTRSPGSGIPKPESVTSIDLLRSYGRSFESKVFEAFDDRDFTGSNELSVAQTMKSEEDTYKEIYDMTGLRKEDIHDVLSNIIDEYGLNFECLYSNRYTQTIGDKPRVARTNKKENKTFATSILLYRPLSNDESRSFEGISDEDFEDIKEYTDEIHDRINDLGFKVHISYDLRLEDKVLKELELSKKYFTPKNNLKSSVNIDIIEIVIFNKNN